MKRTQRQYLADILEAMTAAEGFVRGKEIGDLEDDLQLQWALEREAEYKNRQIISLLISRQAKRL